MYFLVWFILKTCHLSLLPNRHKPVYQIKCLIQKNEFFGRTSISYKAKLNKPGHNRSFLQTELVVVSLLCNCLEKIKLHLCIDLLSSHITLIYINLPDVKTMLKISQKHYPLWIFIIKAHTSMKWWIFMFLYPATEIVQGHRNICQRGGDSNIMRVHLIFPSKRRQHPYSLWWGTAEHTTSEGHVCEWI